MRVGIPKEIKIHEYRVGATPELIKLLSQAGHEVIVQNGAGERLYSDALYAAAGAKMVSSPADVWSADLVVKVKEPQPQEYARLHSEQILFCYLHLAAEPQLTKALVESKAVAIAYETVTDARGRLPLLLPMSEIAGRLAIQIGATYLQMNHGGRGTLLGGVPGVVKGRVVIIGGGVSGTESARIALGLGADVTVLERDLNRLRELENLFGPQLSTRASSAVTIEEALTGADLVVGAVLLPGKRAPCLITRPMLRRMPEGSVFVDISIDQGGCAETSRPTTHSDPVYVEEGVTHYCVTNMPGACGRTATQALTNATSAYVLALANKGYRKAMEEDVGLRQGLNVYRGQVVNREVAEDLGMPFTPLQLVKTS
jgi:alanine dehydrogenase